MAGFYPEKINERFSAPRHAGKIIRANAVGAGASFLCGTFVRFFLEIDLESKKIIKSSFKSNGCGWTIAAADVLAEIIVGRRLTDFHAVDKNFLQTEIVSILGEFPAGRGHCASICTDAIEAATADFRRRQIEEFTGEKALICTCFGISEETIEILVSRNRIETVEEVTDLCNAGGGCGSCRFLIQEIIDVNG